MSVEYDFSLPITDLKADDLKQEQKQKYKKKLMNEHVISDPVSKRRKTFPWFRPKWF